MATEHTDPSTGLDRVLLDVTGLGTLTAAIDADVIDLARAAGRSGDDLVVVCRPRDAKLFKSFDLEVHRAPDRIRTERSRRLWIDWGLPKLARTVGASVIHSPHGVFPLATRLGRVVSVYQSTGANDRARRIVSAVRTDVTVPSQSIADEFRAATGLPANRIHLAPVGVDRERTAIPSWESVEAVGDMYGLTEWLALVATDADSASIEAFRDGYRRATEFSGRRPAVIVLGLSETVALAHFAELIDAGFDIRIVSDVDIAERCAILGGALVAVVLDESRETGRALLDAMACGATVLSRSTPALREFGGDAVDFTEDSPAAVEIALTGLLNNDERRRRFATAGVTRSHQFSWDASLAAHRAAWSRARART